MVRMCLYCCLNLKFHTLWPNPWQSCQKGILEFLSSVEGKLELLFFSAAKYTLSNVFPYILVHVFPTVLTFFKQ